MQVRRVRRKNLTNEEKHAIITDWNNGMSADEVCKKYDIMYWTFQHIKWEAANDLF